MTQPQSWFSDTNVKLGSPLTSRHLKTCLSFASIKHQKALYQLETPRHSAAKMSQNQRKTAIKNINANTREKENQQIKSKILIPSEVIIRQKNIRNRVNSKCTTERQLREIKNNQQRTQQQANSKQIKPPLGILQAYKLQNESLKETIKILKDQVQTLNGSYSSLKYHHAQLKQLNLQQQSRIQQLNKQLHKNRSKEKEFQNIIPKIQELETLQDKMIQQNSALKNKQAIFKDLLTEIVVLVGESNDYTSLQIRKLVRDAFNKL